MVCKNSFIVAILNFVSIVLVNELDFVHLDDIDLYMLFITKNITYTGYLHVDGRRLAEPKTCHYKGIALRTGKSCNI